MKRRSRTERLAAKQDAARVRNIILGTSTWTPERLEREQAEMRDRWHWEREHEKARTRKPTSFGTPLESVV